MEGESDGWENQDKRVVVEITFTHKFDHKSIDRLREMLGTSSPAEYETVADGIKCIIEHDIGAVTEAGRKALRVLEEGFGCKIEKKLKKIDPTDAGCSQR